MRKSLIVIMLSLFVCVCVKAQTAVRTECQFRAVWFSTVANIDWPSKEAIGNTEMQKSEMISLLDSLASLNFNAVIFQVRPTADALFPSALEPWSAWLTGKQGQDNDISYDPLQMMVEEAHKRKMDVHVWINPYRVTLATTSPDEMDKSHLFFRRPEMFWKYNNQWYFEPGLDETREWLCRVVADLVRRYDIEGVHMDDYFYPYPDHKTKLPDEKCFKQHPRGFDNIDDWRRNNVNMAIRQLHDTIKSIKPDVQFGISPFGIWRNKQNDERGSLTTGLQNYDELYADVLLWMQEGWIDYVVPQLYWQIGSRAADHKELAEWWARNAGKAKVYIGLAAYRQEDPAKAKKEGKKLNMNSPWANGNEICRQLRLHEQISNIEGEVFFSLKPLLANPMGLCDSLRTTFFPTWVPTP